ncbi:phosphomevalonate kinase [Cellulomonas sp. PhB143]|uniref:phosphomevalonate kinase n=1 Tax=Cellulomonas sp. PhB143 TaxID=2485186 RepID=UPI000FAADB9E|nr:phosphomevalonate kinase [Cellulomonas sp. PhB143]ROS74422.1 phosphomevalonate kinase [Cellulomonas sp. PhB143]
MIRVQAPGKLYVAGEYAVVDPGGAAVLVAVDRYVTVDLHERADDGAGTVRSRQLATGGLAWVRERGDLVPTRPDPTAAPVLAAVRAADALALARGRRPRGYDLAVSSTLDAEDGRKLGLGSSAAVTVAAVRAVAALHGLDLSDLAVLKVALAAQVTHDPSGSGGDLAASAHGGWVRYTSPDRAAVAALVAAHGLPAAVERDWPGLGVAALPAPASVDLHVGWTGVPASSRRLVADALTPDDRSPAADRRDALRDLRTGSDRAVEALAAALRADDARRMLGAVRDARSALTAYGRRTGVVIETPALTALVDAAERAGGAGKSSGAGGGDCGIALLPAGHETGTMTAAWRDSGVQLLPLRVTAPAGQPTATDRERR